MSDPVLMPFKSARHDHSRCVDQALASAESTCLARGLRLTSLRRKVLALVWRHHGPVKAYEILDLLRENHRGAAPPTVYRALDFLLQQGFIHRLESLNAYVGCGDPRVDHTGQFLICRQCHAVAELHDPEIAALLASRVDQMGFHMDRPTVEITGLCPKCG